MRLLPNMTINFKTNLSKTEFIRQFSGFAELKSFDANQWYNNMFRKKTKNYIGYLDKDLFKLEPLVKYSNAPFLIIKGNVFKENNHCVVNVKLSLPVIAKIAIILFITMGCLILGLDYWIQTLTNGKPILREYPMIIAFPLVIYIYVIIGFNYQSNRFIRQFSRYFKVENQKAS